MISTFISDDSAGYLHACQHLSITGQGVETEAGWKRSAATERSLLCQRDFGYCVVTFRQPKLKKI